MDKLKIYQDRENKKELRNKLINETIKSQSNISNDELSQFFDQFISRIQSPLFLSNSIDMSFLLAYTSILEDSLNNYISELYGI